MCIRFWRICFDNFGEGCFPVDQAESIRESLGLNTIPVSSPQSQSIVAPGSPQDEMAAEAVRQYPFISVMKQANSCCYISLS